MKSIKIIPSGIICDKCGFAVTHVYYDDERKLILCKNCALKIIRGS